jgi:hypothetical protein
MLPEELGTPEQRMNLPHGASVVGMDRRHVEITRKSGSSSPYANP